MGFRESIKHSASSWKCLLWTGQYSRNFSLLYFTTLQIALTFVVCRGHFGGGGTGSIWRQNKHFKQKNICYVLNKNYPNRVTYNLIQWMWFFKFAISEGRGRRLWSHRHSLCAAGGMTFAEHFPSWQWRCWNFKLSAMWRCDAVTCRPATWRHTADDLNPHLPSKEMQLSVLVRFKRQDCCHSCVPGGGESH